MYFYKLNKYRLMALAINVGLVMSLFGCRQGVLPASTLPASESPIVQTGPTSTNNNPGYEADNPAEQLEISSPELENPESPSNSGTPQPPQWYWLYFSAPTYNGKASIINPAFLTALLDTINMAEKTLDIAVLEIDLDQISRAIQDAASRGVRVRVVCDSDGLKDEQALKDLVNAGIPLVPDERQELMHDKFMVVDGEYVWTGSYNFTFNDTYRNDNNAILINSPNLAQNYTAEFEEMFIRKKFGNDSPANTIYKQLNLEGSEVTTCFSPEDRCAKMLVGLINGSQASIRFMAYSFTDDAIGRAMLQRSRAGVDVSGVFETRGSETEFSEYAYLKQNNMDVRLDGNPYNMHHKVIILDDETVITGSYNFSNNASNYNDENLLIIENPGLAKKFLEEYKRVYSLAVTK